MSGQQGGVGRILTTYGLWLVLGTLAGFAAWQINTLIIYLGVRVIDSPTLRPSGWFMGTLASLNRFSLLILGGAWIFFVTWLEEMMRRRQSQGDLLRYSGRVGAILAGIWLLAYLLPLLLDRF